ncbi:MULTISPECIES: flagellar assembly protein FliW [unclassified Campylobacter]|uniref:flagellar assembly protein FliW n=1 Tax=unclassified Campylobacter TaxID=2593542 RepID=UPI001237EA90|nr:MULTISPECIES: flagellar assembly protein FliW [unclassified Campylobacter]KAA6225261.1 flagellar assembly protein FliW [Campylobacter sp. LR185c]KAA6227677.1 flagellar assembly protein FliW [Campylobacter sp. LR286c]KAA6227769.1 flagellar assembly protein FliW [Campylobacter sp. LR196d]KAA6229971.1 flagellar assembly protein FliW [Campylobacter sp. LR264d]KAA6233611.1 flagellar assembly protein FliW [Campylobacter sp. LR291e]
MTLDVKYPIVGFEKTSKVELSKIDDLFVQIKSLDGDDFTIVLINPYAIRPEYEFDIPANYQALLGITNDSKHVEIYNTVGLAKTVGESTVNFLAPFVINKDNNTIVQVILDIGYYPNYFQADKISKYIKQ